MSSRRPSPPGSTRESADLLDRSGLVPLRATVMALLTGLAVQFALGIYANLYVSFPANAPSTEGLASTGGMASMGGLASTGGMASMGGLASMGGMATVMDHVGLAAHMVLGFLLAAAGIAAVVFAAQARLPAAIWLAGIGLASVVGAGIAGMIFVMGDQSNTASYVMAIGFLVSFSCYFAELTVTRP